MNIETLIKYSQPGPRYTSYPTAPVFNDSFGPDEYREVLRQSNQTGNPLSLYFHIPFCKSVCYFCACSVVYTANQDRAEPYLALLKEEMNIISSEINSNRQVSQLHWGGGSPTFLSPDQMTRLWRDISSTFSFTSDAEISIELDPRTTKEDHLRVLFDSGFNRASLGVQDLDPEVQKAVNRVQPLELSTNLVEKVRRNNFRGVNFDLIYGLPGQTVVGFNKTLDAILDIRPDRISLFHFAYLPKIKKHQNRIREEDLPDINTRLEIFRTAVDRFLDVGYIYIGMDHFALPEDELARAQKNHELHRNFQGYTTRSGCDLIGFGLTSIGDLGFAYAQNAKTMEEYDQAIRSGQPATCRGLVLSPDDLIRHRAIMNLICHFELDLDQLDREFKINSAEYFREELDGLRTFQEEGLLQVEERGVRITETGKFVIRNICMVFDAHLKRLTEKGQTFSKTV